MVANLKKVDDFIYFLMMKYLPVTKITEAIRDVQFDLTQKNGDFYKWAKELSKELIPRDDEIEVVLKVESQQDRLQDGKEAIEALVKSGQMSEEDAAKILSDIGEFDGRSAK